MKRCQHKKRDANLRERLEIEQAQIMPSMLPSQSMGHCQLINSHEGEKILKYTFNKLGKFLYCLKKNYSFF